MAAPDLIEWVPISPFWKPILSLMPTASMAPSSASMSILDVAPNAYYNGCPCIFRAEDGISRGNWGWLWGSPTPFRKNLIFKKQCKPSSSNVGSLKTLSLKVAAIHETAFLISDS
eukprot:scaffold6601_cov51-Cyclotella_meneghiniana.AAC.1